MRKQILISVGLVIVLFVSLVGMMVTARGVFGQVPTRERLLSAYNASGGTSQIVSTPGPAADQYWVEVTLPDGRVVTGEALKRDIEEHAAKGDLNDWMRENVNGSPISGRSYVFRAYRPNALLGFTDASDFSELLFLGCEIDLPEHEVVGWRGEVVAAGCVNLACQIVVAYYGE
jgi:hypothetical protein